MSRNVAKRDSTKAVCAEVRAWWEEKDADQLVDSTALAQAICDVGVLSLAHLARQLTNKRVSDAEKTRIALILSPKMVAEARGRLPKGGRGGGPPQGAAHDSGAELLEDYGVDRVRMRTG